MSSTALQIPVAFPAPKKTTKAAPSSNGPALTSEHHAAIRGRARAYFEDHKHNPSVSQSKVGRRIGFTSGAAVLSSYLAGTYKGDNDRVARLLEAYLDQQELIAAFGDETFEPSLSTVLEIERAIELAEATHGIARIVGNTGTSKTATLMAYAHRREAILLDGRELQTVRAVIATMYASPFLWGKTLNRRRPTCDVQLDVISALQKSPRTLLVDESEYMSPLAAESLRLIADRTRTAIVLASERLCTYSGAFEGRLVAEVMLDEDVFTEGNVALLALRRLSSSVFDAAKGDLLDEARLSGGFRRVSRVLSVAQSIAGKGRTIDEGDVTAAIRKLRRAKGGAK